MTKNSAASTLKIIGKIEVICGIVVALAIFIEAGELDIIGVGIILASSVTCAMFDGFAEIINLLQKNADIQEKILHNMNNTDTGGHAPASVLQDIESNLPPL